MATGLPTPPACSHTAAKNVSDMLAAAVYLLCFLASTGCAGILMRGFIRSHRRLLFWSALSFALLAANNLFVVVDVLVLTEGAFQLPRLALSLGAVLVIIYGFLFDMGE